MKKDSNMKEYGDERTHIKIDVEIKPAVLRDLEEICSIEKLCFSDPWSPGIFKSAFAQQDVDTGILVAKIKDKIVGYLITQQILIGQNLYEVHINNVAVLPDFRRIGIGSFLFEHLLQTIKHAYKIGTLATVGTTNAKAAMVEGITLEVRTSNEVAITFYKKHGFVVEGMRKEYYDHAEEGESRDAFIMWYYSDPILMAIESSCDETSVAVLEGGRKVLANEIYTQIDVHKKYGGVVPEIASRNHLEKIDAVVQEALVKSGKTFKDIDVVVSTAGPGLVGALLVGLTYSKALAYSLGVDFVGVNHIEGHIASNYIAHPELEPPFLCLVISGGHTHLVDVKSYTDFEVIGKTLDDAVGEAYDKIARTMGLGYPGGPVVDKLAHQGKGTIDFPRAMLTSGDLNFSFSGLKSAVLNYINSCKMKNIPYVVEDICASFQSAVVDILKAKTEEALRITGRKNFAIAGGVSANSAIRQALQFKGVNTYMPPLALCTDNAAMIGAAGYYYYANGYRSSLDLNASPSVIIGDKSFVRKNVKSGH